MGVCWCKNKNTDRESDCPQRRTSFPFEGTIIYHTSCNGVDYLPEIINYRSRTQTIEDKKNYVERLILETLSVIGYLVDNEQEPPSSMLKLHTIADNEEGWIEVVTSMTRVIPMDNPLGPSVITLLMDDCPLPSRNSILKVSQLFDLTTESAISGRNNPAQQRNTCVVLGCIAEKLAGPNSTAILSQGTLDYLFANLDVNIDANVILFSIIALEKFAQTRENKSTIQERLSRFETNPLIPLEQWAKSNDFVKRQVGFCAQWCLDNLFITDGRKFSYELEDMSNINTMLNTGDVSEYLKISPDGLEARCDAYFFESVRCTTAVDSGVWYYEVTIISSGVMQIGWATKNSNFLNHEGYGIGDDTYSIAYDGCRCLVWYGAHSEPQATSCWKPGDILGCLIDLNQPPCCIFYINGQPLPVCTQIFNMVKSGFFAAASFMSFQQCRFNFGAEAFKYPPKDYKFESLNSVLSEMSLEEKRVMPRHLLNQLRRFSINEEDSCTLCFDQRATVRLIPCDHRGFCTQCASQITECPMCRSQIHVIVPDSPL